MRPDCRACAIDYLEPIDGIDWSDPRAIIEANDLIPEYGPSAAPAVSPHQITRMADDELASFLSDLRNAIKLPLHSAFVRGLTVVLGFTEAEAQHRIATARRREERVRCYGESDWQSADFLSEVEAVAGPLKRRGREWWACCPFHQERTPSFHVNAEAKVWHCFGCGAGGGVLDWRRRIEAAA